MKIFGLADPHLGQGVDKAMDVFGPRWERHAERMAERWRATVGARDWVLWPMVASIWIAMLLTIYSGLVYVVAAVKMLQRAEP